MPGFRTVAPRGWVLFLVLAIAANLGPVVPAISAPEGIPVVEVHDTSSLTISEYDCPPGTAVNDLSKCVPASQPWDITVVHAESGVKVSTLADAVAVGTGAFTFTAIPAGDYTIIGGDPDGAGKIEVLYAEGVRTDGDIATVTVKPGTAAAFSIFSIPPTVAGELPLPPATGIITIRLYDCPPATMLPEVGVCVRPWPEVTYSVNLTHLETGREWSGQGDGDWYQNQVGFYELPLGTYRLTPVSDDESMFDIHVSTGRLAVTSDGTATVSITSEEWGSVDAGASLSIFRTPVRP